MPLQDECEMKFSKPEPAPQTTRPIERPVSVQGLPCPARFTAPGHPATALPHGSGGVGVLLAAPLSLLAAPCPLTDAVAIEQGAASKRKGAASKRPYTKCDTRNRPFPIPYPLSPI